MKNKLIIIALIISNIVNAQKYKEIGIINDLKLIIYNNKIGIMDYNNNIKIPLSNYTKIEYDNNYNLYKCYKGNEFEIFFDSFEKLNSNCFFTKIIDNSDNSELIKIKSKKGFGYIYKNKLIIPPIYDKLTYEVETYFGTSVNIILEKDGLLGINLLNDKNILEPEYNKLIKIKNSKTFIVTKSKLKGLIYPGYNLNKLPVEYSKIEKISNFEFYEDELFLVKKNKLTGLYCAKNNVFIIPTIFSEIDLTDLNKYVDVSNHYIIKKNGKKGIIKINSTSYEIIIPVIYEKLDMSKAKKYNDFYTIPAKHNSTKGFVILAEGTPKSLSSFIKEVYYNDNYDIYYIKNDLNKWGLWNSDSNKIDYKYDKIVSFDYNKIKVELNGKEFYIKNKW